MRIFLASLLFLSGAHGIFAQTWTAASPNIYFSGGNVGIQTSTPTSALQVNGIISVKGGAGNEQRGGSGSGLQLIGGYTSPVVGRMIIGDNTGWKFHYSYKDGNGTLGDLFTFQDNGNLGIGTTSPASKLDVNGTINSSSSIHASAGIVSDVAMAGGLSGWFRGPASGNSDVIIQGGAGTAAAFWRQQDQQSRLTTQILGRQGAQSELKFVRRSAFG